MVLGTELKVGRARWSLERRTTQDMHFNLTLHILRGRARWSLERRTTQDMQR